MTSNRNFKVGTPYGIASCAIDLSHIFRHVGDLGNVYADRDGTVRVIKRDYIVSLVGKYNVLGRAFVVSF